MKKIISLLCVLFLTLPLFGNNLVEYSQYLNKQKPCAVSVSEKAAPQIQYTVEYTITDPQGYTVTIRKTVYLSPSSEFSRTPNYDDGTTSHWGTGKINAVIPWEPGTPNLHPLSNLNNYNPGNTLRLKSSS